tara:strand:+ start:131 stop:280 length:150 start_codon:yes stop_codon:yes gene_type:complete
MIEVLKHSLGLCGEHWHPNIFTFLLSGLGLSPALSYIYHKVKSYDKSKS